MLSRNHELHRRRSGRNGALGVILGALVLLIFAVTVVKLAGGGEIRGFDHTYESLVPAE
ncbi:MAG: cytochrome C oxidase assembly protein [Pseudomonadota bacterium]